MGAHKLGGVFILVLAASANGAAQGHRYHYGWVRLGEVRGMQPAKLAEIIGADRSRILRFELDPTPDGVRTPPLKRQLEWVQVYGKRGRLWRGRDIVRMLAAKRRLPVRLLTWPLGDAEACDRS